MNRRTSLHSGSQLQATLSPPSPSSLPFLLLDFPFRGPIRIGLNDAARVCIRVVSAMHAFLLFLGVHPAPGRHTLKPGALTGAELRCFSSASGDLPGPWAPPPSATPEAGLCSGSEPLESGSSAFESQLGYYWNSEGLHTCAVTAVLSWASHRPEALPREPLGPDVFQLFLVSPGCHNGQAGDLPLVGRCGPKHISLDMSLLFCGSLILCPA